MSKVVTLTTIKPNQPPMRLMRNQTEGIEPIKRDYYIQKDLSHSTGKIIEAMSMSNLYYVRGVIAPGFKDSDANVRFLKDIISHQLVDSGSYMQFETGFNFELQNIDNRFLQ